LDVRRNTLNEWASAKLMIEPSISGNANTSSTVSVLATKWDGMRPSAEALIPPIGIVS
jgi:hypothetical protein